jgi:PAS domain S-box-containing protein
MTGNRRGASGSLRRKAENQLQESNEKAVADKLVRSDLSELLHELQIHLVELEIQNEELRGAQAAILASHQRFADLFHRAPVGYLVLDHAGMVLDVNETFCQMTGRDAKSIKSRSFFDLIVDSDRSWFMARYKALYKQPERKNIELVMLAGDNQPFYASLSAVLYQAGGVNESEGAHNLLVTISDISSRKRAEQALQAQTDLLATVFDSSPNILILVNDDGRVDKINRKGSEYVGNPQEELIGLLGGEVFKCINSFHGRGCGRNPECGDCPIRTRVARSMQKGETILNEEGRLTVRKEAQEIPLDFLISTVPVEVAGAFKVLVTLVDISERKKVDEALRQSELENYTILRTALDGFCLVDPHSGRILDVNESYCQMSGYTREEALQLTIADLEANEVPGKVQAHAERIGVSGSDRFESKHRRKDGSIFHIEVSVQSLKNDGGRNFAFIRDITARKQAERDLQKSEERYRLLFNEMLSGFALHEVICDERGKPVDYRFLTVNAAFEQLTGLKAAELIGKTVQEVMPGIEPYWIERYGKVALEDKTDQFDGYSAATGRFYEARAFCPEPEKFAVMFHDITERKHAEGALAQERQRLSNVIEGTNVGTWEWNVQTGKTVFNERWAEIIGYDLEEISPISIETWVKHTHPEDLEKSNELLEKHFKGELNYYECEIRMLHKNGNWVWVLDRGKVSSWTDDGKPILIAGTHQDITSRKQAEENLKRLLHEKEILLAEVHHRVKNNMQIITSLLGLQAHETQDKRLLSAIDESRQRIQSMALVHEQLYRAGEYAQIDFGDYVEQLASSIFNIYQIEPGQVELRVMGNGENLVLEKAIPCGLLLNELITNSLKYAFPNSRKGILQISLERRMEMLILQVSDDGIGIPASFELESAHSLGLQLVNLLAVHDLHGQITLDRQQGTHFRIEFPV